MSLMVAPLIPMTHPIAEVGSKNLKSTDWEGAVCVEVEVEVPMRLPFVSRRSRERDLDRRDMLVWSGLAYNKLLSGLVVFFKNAKR